MGFFKGDLLVFALMMWFLGELFGYAVGLRHRPKQRTCTDCGDKWDGLCVDCRLKLNGEMSLP